MKFSDFYNNNRMRYSVEVFPPKTPKGVDALFSELTRLKAIDPVYVSVTYGAMGTTRDLTQDLALKIHDTLNLTTAFHFTCIGSNRDEIKSYVQNLRRRGIKLIVALRGDKPHDTPDYVPPKDGFRYANELVGYLKSIDDFSIAVAGYPEKHIEAPSLAVDIENLKRKVDAGADMVITQLFFDNNDYYAWLARVRAAGVRVPVIPGIMPILKFDQIRKITGMCGAKIPDGLMRQLEACKGNESAMRDVGVAHAIRQCRDLKKNNAVGIHFYCMNKADSVLKIVEAL